jgi:hemerythrin-like domain-containing protein
MDEHRVIERMLKILNVACEKLEIGEKVSPEVFTKAIDFVRTFADGCHHGKEEDTLFPMVEKHGLPRDRGPTGVMMMEHEQGRKYIRGLAEAVEKYSKGDKAVERAILENARGYVSLLSRHIPKEDTILYPLADRMLGPDEQEELLEKFEKIEMEKIGPGKHEYYLNMIKELENELGIVEMSEHEHE